jgi:uncharacterized RDD family membrane protein YckC
MLTRTQDNSKTIFAVNFVSDTRRQGFNPACALKAVEYEVSFRTEPRLRMTPPTEGKIKQPAGLQRRLLAIVYDAVIVLGLLLLATAAIMPFVDTQPMAMRDPLFSLWLLCVWFSYLCWCWRKGMTLGMRAWKLRLQTDSGHALTVPRCLLRFLVSLAGASVLGAGYLWSLADSRRRCWHDIATGTCLVRL